MIHQCKKCLLLEAGEDKSYNTILEYINQLPAELKVDDNEYKNRLSECKKCDNLISGMCLKCGCYVEVRAILKNKKCPDTNKLNW